jgi:hypothetical protein
MFLFTVVSPDSNSVTLNINRTVYRNPESPQSDFSYGFF